MYSIDGACHYFNGKKSCPVSAIKVLKSRIPLLTGLVFMLQFELIQENIQKTLQFHPLIKTNLCYILSSFLNHPSKVLTRKFGNVALCMVTL